MQAESDWTKAFPGLAALDADARALLRAGCSALSLPAGELVFRDGSPCRHYLFVLSGRLRVHKLAEGGHEITLYRVAEGDTCIVTTACLMIGCPYNAEGITETEVQAQGLSAPAFRELLARSEAFRSFVFAAFGHRIVDLLTLIEAVSFGRIESRLCARLLALARDQDTVDMTHQDLAVELGSAREVVSRHLKDFERRGWIALRRGQIRLIDRQALLQARGPSRAV